MLASLGMLCAVVFGLGYLASAYMYKHKRKKFSRSSLQIKVLMWLPIFLVVALLYQQILVTSVLILAIVIKNLVSDYTDQQQNGDDRLNFLYLTSVIGGTVLLWSFSFSQPTLFLGIWFLSVVSDVFAFFIGNIFGTSKLPKAINPNKSWQGVAGQFIGAYVGCMLFSRYVADLPAGLWLLVGVGSALGDMLNSYLKRLAGITDWSQRIPGHGGYLDRLSSLSYAAILASLVLL